MTRYCVEVGEEFGGKGGEGGGGEGMGDFEDGEVEVGGGHEPEGWGLVNRLEAMDVDVALLLLLALSFSPWFSFMGREREETSVRQDTIKMRRRWKQ